METVGEIPLQERKRVLGGVLLWIVFCAALIVIRGVRWDETFEDAQVLLRHVVYPEGHPRFAYCRNVLSAQTYSSAALLALGAGPGLLCGLRNMAALAFSVIPIFLLASLVTRKAIWGHAAALLALFGAYRGFATTYPLTVWPSLYSYGQIGMGYTLLTFYLLLAGRWRSAFFLLGLMPCIHIGQMPVLLLVSIVYFGIAWFTKQRALCKRAVIGGCLGAALCLAFAAVHSGFSVPLPASGAYYSAEDPYPIWEGFTWRYDMHRQRPRSDTHIVLVGALLLAGAATYLHFAGRPKDHDAGNGLRPPVPVYLGLLLYCALTALTVWGVVIVREIEGSSTPFWLTSWMPFRLGNHVAPLLFILVMGLLAETWRSGPRVTLPTSAFLGAAVLYAALASATDSLLAALRYGGPFSELLSRYLATGFPLFFGLYGVVVGLLPLRLREKRVLVLPYALLVVAAFVLLSTVHQFGTGCFLMGFVAALSLRGLPPRLMRCVGILEQKHVAVVLCVCLALALVFAQWEGRAWLPRKPLSEKVASVLAERGDPDAVIVAPMDALNLQAETGHPILAQQDTPYMICYIPALGPSVEKMYNDVYETTFTLRPGSGYLPQSDWKWETWWNRPESRWRDLAQMYGFRYVLVPSGHTLPLTPILEESDGALYAMP